MSENMIYGLMGFVSRTRFSVRPENCDFRGGIIEYPEVNSSDGVVRSECVETISDEESKDGETHFLTRDTELKKINNRWVCLQSCVYNNSRKLLQITRRQ